MLENISEFGSYCGRSLNIGFFVFLDFSIIYLLFLIFIYLYIYILYSKLNHDGYKGVEKVLLTFTA